MQITITKGLDIPIIGTPDPVLEADNATRAIRSVAVLGGDYIGLRPKMRVQTGDRVSLGQPLFADKHDPAVLFTAPGSGVITAVNRGARRALQSVVISLDESVAEEPTHADLIGTDPDVVPVETLRSALFTSGLWTSFRTRPYNKVPLSDSEPRSIFVTAIDTQPLAANPATVVAADREAFQYGLRIVVRLTNGPVYLCTAPGWEGPQGDGERIQHVEFAGPHPAGLPGTHIHHLDPVGPGRTVWHIGYQDVIAIGKLFSEGRIRVERTVALGGSGFARPRLVTTRLGANIDELVAGTLKTDGKPLRLISGSVLNGRTAVGPEAYLGRYHVQISAIPDGVERRWFGWLDLFGRHYRFAGLFPRRSGHKTLRPFSSARLGRTTAMVPVDAFEQVMPLDILPVPLLRALLIGDTDQAQALGCLELDGEDLALCSFVCPGKIDYATALRMILDRIEREG
jgi:Na+-transporting NADH:ubiquinone oxidoreductase subunit A